MKKLLLFSALLGFMCFWSGVGLYNTLTSFKKAPVETTIAYLPTNQAHEAIPHANIHENNFDEEVVDPTTLVTTPVPTDLELTGKRTDIINARLKARQAKKNPVPGAVPTPIPAPVNTTLPKPSPLPISTTTTPKPAPLPIVTTPTPVPKPTPIPTPVTTTLPKSLPLPISTTTPKPAPLPIVTTPTPVPKPTPIPAAPIVVAKPIKWGVFAGSNPTTIADFESRVSENPDYLAFFVHWGNGGGALPQFLSDAAYKKNRTLVLFWEASDYIIGGTNQPNYSYRSILAGNWDGYFKDFANQLKTYQGPVILVPFSELNGNWTPWSGTVNGNTPAQAVEAWRYVHKFFNEVPNVKFGLAVNSNSVPDTPENNIANYYPGDAYVDYVGVDGFNMDYPWMTFNELFARPLSILEQYNKPIMIFSYGSAPGPQKAAWLNEGLNVVLPNHPLVVGWVYFNQNKERNWLLWSDPATYSIFTKYITQ